MTISEFFNFINYISAKENSGRTLSPYEFNLIVPQSQYDFILQEIKDWQKISEDIRVLKKTVTLTPVSGIVSLPADYMMFETDFKKYVTALRYTGSQVDRKSTRLNSSHSQISY